MVMARFYANVYPTPAAAAPITTTFSITILTPAFPVSVTLAALPVLVAVPEPLSLPLAVPVPLLEGFVPLTLPTIPLDALDELVAVGVAIAVSVAAAANFSCPPVTTTGKNVI